MNWTGAAPVASSLLLVLFILTAPWHLGGREEGRLSIGLALFAFGGSPASRLRLRGRRNLPRRRSCSGRATAIPSDPRWRALDRTPPRPAEAVVLDEALNPYPLSRTEMESLVRNLRLDPRYTEVQRAGIALFIPKR